jgi:hypothetical protein
MNDFTSRCFVCQKKLGSMKTAKNQELNLPVCEQCKGTDEEKEMVKRLTDELADGFVCGCM